MDVLPQGFAVKNWLLGLAIACILASLVTKAEFDRRDKQVGLSSYKRVVTKRDRPRVLDFGADW